MEVVIKKPSDRLRLSKIELPNDLVLAIREPMKVLSKKFHINRAHCCYISLLYYLDSMEGSKIGIEHYDMYIMSALIIYSKIYSESQFSYTEAMKIRGIAFDLKDLQKTVSILSEDNLFSQLSQIHS